MKHAVIKFNQEDVCF